MNITWVKQLLSALVVLLLIDNTSLAQVAGSNNTLGSTGITAIQSGTATGYKLSIGGAAKVFGTGNAGVVGSPTLIIGNNTASTGRKYGIYSSNAGQFQIYDSTGTTPTIRFNIAPTTGNIGIGTLTVAAANKLEIDNTTANTSGLRFTRLMSTSTVSTLNGKQLSVNATGDVILTTDSLSIVQSPNRILAGPATGSTSIIPTFRSLVALDIPNLDMAKITTGNLPLTRVGNVTPARLLGRFNAAAGTVEEISLGTGLALNASGVLSAPGGGSMVYPAAGIAVSTGTAWSTSITDNSANWNNAFTDRLKWDGGATGLIAATGRTSLGASTIGGNLFTATNPSAISFLRANADNTVSFLDAASFRTAIGAESQWTTNGANISNNNTGNIGLGVSSPIYKLDVLSNSGTTANFKNGENNNAGFTQVDIFRPNAASNLGQGMSIIALGSSYSSSGALKADGGFYGANAGASGGLSIVSSHANGQIRFYTGGASDANQQLTINSTGKVGVGTITPTEKLDVNGNIFTNGKILVGHANTAAVTPYALAVNGSAIFTKAVVKLSATWPDYVFEPNYGLLPIAQLEKYISQYKHLPNIPSAAEVKKEGIDLGNSQTLQLQKIEELTLYIIDLNKKIEALQKDNVEIKKQLNPKEQNK